MSKPIKRNSLRKQYKLVNIGVKKEDYETRSPVFDGRN